jgi:molybdate transport system substrate-binding protein
VQHYFIFFVLLLPCCALADTIRIAVASNFSEPIKEIAEQYKKHTGHRLILSFGSTGKHYAQIKNGAPYDLFLAADVHRPELLEQQGVAITDSRFTYARGRLVLWSQHADYVDAEGKILESAEFRHLAIANPKLAPYGKAAQEVLQSKGLWEPLQSRLVKGESIGQTYQFVSSGNAELGFVAYSQIKRPNHSDTGSYWVIPQANYEPIEQQAVLLKENAVARDFMSFLQTQEIKKIITKFGYDVW